ncbi:hypothetical protein KP79_PYT22107 [Mizuhopecten yessoensis]|uniref:Tetraspanin n=1 Tax=Mizuhopecten yessoensis TaxID=6573 RepID=A0A210PU86_MIZYE|nr:hypothetical protein KP79_PYT22107 [Mizuhopecten yessoensis]
MACLPFICDPKVKRGLMPIGVNILLVSVLLFRLISSGCAVYALVMLHTDAVLQTVHTSFVDTLYVFGRIPLGYMLVVITYSCACAMMPVQVINSVMGLAGVLFTKRSIVYAHICMSFFTIPVMMVYAVLLAGGLRDFYYGIDDKFRNEINTGTHADDIKTKLSCCGFSGEDPCMNFYLYYPYKKIPGCWDLWSSPFHNFLSTMLAFVISMLILEVLNLVVTDYEYRKWRLNEEPERPENTGVLPYISRDAFGDICVSIVLYWRKGALSFVMRSLALCQGCVGVSLVIYGGYSIKEYPSFVSEFSISRLRFNNIYFDDLIRILSSLLVLCGGVSLFTSLQGVSVTCVTSRAAYYVSALVNILGVVMTVTVIIFWAVFYAKVRYGMEQEVEDLFSISLRYDPYLQYALDLVQTLKCCGITGQQDFMNLVPSGTWNRISPHCSNFRPCAPVLQDHFRTFSGVGLSLVSFLLLLQMVSFICANKKMGELSTGTSVSESERTRPTAEHEPIIPAAEHEPTSPAAEHEPISVISEPMQTTPAVRKGVIGILKRRVTQLWADDKANGVGIVLKFVSLLFGLSLVVTGLLLKFDDIFDDIDLHTLFYKLGFNNRRFTYYLVAVAYCMLGLGISEMAIVFYGLLIYCWNSKFLEYILIVLRGSFCAVLIVIIGLSIESKSNIDWTMYDQLITEFKTYQSYSYENTGLTWKLLYFKMECCGVGNYGDFNSITMTNSRQIPIYCCKNVTEWRPDLDSGMESCTDSLVSGTFHETGCNDALLDRFGGYMITFFNLLSFLVIFQVFDIALSARRIRMLKPGSPIDKEFGILLKSVTGEVCNNKITDSSEELVTREPQSNQQPQTGEDMKRNTILPSLDVDAARGQQPPPNTTTLPSETTTKAESRGRRSKRRRDKKRLAKSTHSVEVHRLESAEQDETFEPVTSQGNDSMKVEQNEDDKVATVRRFARNPSARPPAGSGRKGRRSEKQVTIETEIDNNPAILVRNESETKPQTMNVNASRKDGEKYKNDRPYSNGDPMPTTAQRPNNDLQGSLSTMHAAPNISKNTNVEIVRSAETVHNDNASSGEKARDMETRKREQEDETLLNTAEYNLDHSSTMLDKESDKSDVHQQENSILGDSGVEEKFPNGVTSYTAETSGRIERETVVSDSKKGWTEELRESGVSGKDKDTTENIMKFEKLDKETENKVDFGISDGHIEEAVNSGAVDGSPEKVVITEISDGQTDKEYISGTSDKLTQSEAPGTAGKISDAKEEDETLNNSEKKDNDFPYVYDDDFSDEDEDDNNTGAIDLFTKIAGD